MAKEFITSDQHFGHKKILQYQHNTRPFSSLDEMHHELITRHNEVVSDDDKIYMLGDFAFLSANKTEEILKQLNGEKFFIFGNHDHQMKKLSQYFTWMKHYHKMKVGENTVIMFHYPIFSWDHMAFGSYHFYGHTHNQIPNLYHGKSKDIGVDGNMCYPYDMEELINDFERIESDDFDPRNRGTAR